MSEIEARERALKAKEESWKSEHAQKLSELGLQQRRLREEARHQVTSYPWLYVACMMLLYIGLRIALDAHGCGGGAKQVVLERMKTKSLEKQLASQTKQLEDARARMASAEEDLERFKEKQRKTSEGSLRQELILLGAAKAEAESQARRHGGMAVLFNHG